MKKEFLLIKVEKLVKIIGRENIENLKIQTRFKIPRKGKIIEQQNTKVDLEQIAEMQQTLHKIQQAIKSSIIRCPNKEPLNKMITANDVNSLN